MIDRENQYSTGVWLARVQGLQSHLRIIRDECAGSDDDHVRRIGRQAEAGIVEADRYIADRDWAAYHALEHTAAEAAEGGEDRG